MKYTDPQILAVRPQNRQLAYITENGGFGIDLDRHKPLPAKSFPPHSKTQTSTVTDFPCRLYLFNIMYEDYMYWYFY